MLYEGEDGATLNLTGVILVMASALTYALYIVGVNRPMLKDVATLKVTFYVLVFGLILFFVRLDFGRDLHVVNEWYTWLNLWLNLLALAAFPTAMSFLCTTRAIQYIGSTPTAILGALEPLTAVFFGVLVFGESMTPRIACGIVLIVVAVTLIIAGNKLPATTSPTRSCDSGNFFPASRANTGERRNRQPFTTMPIPCLGIPAFPATAFVHFPKRVRQHSASSQAHQNRCLPNRSRLSKG